MSSPARKFKVWFFEGMKGKPAHQSEDAWWKVMCLTGTDYFSSMGFQPSISYTAAGLLAPLATFNLVLLTMLGALPTYWIVSKVSPHGQGSFAIFERLLTGWKGKTLVLILLGFAATDFIFTITMCAADATAHIAENPYSPALLKDHLLVTLVLVGSLGAVFLKGFEEAVRISFYLVVIYLAVNLVTLTVCLQKIALDPAVISNYTTALLTTHHSYLEMFKTAALVFPQLALGMSGFETGVAVMPLVKPAGEDSDKLAGRIRNTRKLLVTVAVIMSIFLMIGSFVTTVLIPADLYKPHGAADGRALAYLCHLYLGDAFGTVYDLSTILILWFAGASGMAALLSLVPQYLPRYGMAPGWAAARRPLVVFFTILSAVITIIFKAEVNAQAGAFATGLLVMITSACVAVTALVFTDKQWQASAFLKPIFAVISLVFIYASVQVTRERPDGIFIAFFFIATVLVLSLVSRALRSTELRISSVVLDERARSFIDCACHENLGEIRLLAHRPDSADYTLKEADARVNHSIQNPEGNFIFLEVTPLDVSEFIDETLEVTGHEFEGYRIFRCSSPSVPNAIAALLLYLRDETGKIPHAYFGWTEGNPIFYTMKYILLGEGETAPLTREILRLAEHNPDKRPRVHVS